MLVISLLILASGVILLLQKLGILSSQTDIWWPVLLIILGLVMFIKSISKRKDFWE